LARGVLRQSDINVGGGILTFPCAFNVTANGRQVAFFGTLCTPHPGPPKHPPLPLVSRAFNVSVNGKMCGAVFDFDLGGHPYPIGSFNVVVA
jgi:hypothetical protein